MITSRHIITMDDNDMEEKTLLSTFDSRPCLDHQNHINYDISRFHHSQSHYHNDHFAHNTTHRQQQQQPQQHQQQQRQHLYLSQLQDPLFSHDQNNIYNHLQHRNCHRRRQHEPNWNDNHSVSSAMTTNDEPLDINDTVSVDANVSNLVGVFCPENTTREDEVRFEKPTAIRHINDEPFDNKTYGGDQNKSLAKRMSIEQGARKQEPDSRRTSAKDKQESKAYRVGNPKKDDILCGQSRLCASHSGNRHFQKVLNEYAEKYQRATSKQQKMIMTKEIVDLIHETGGKFIKCRDGTWEEISTVAARDKVSHALRTKVASRKRQRSQEGSSNSSSSKSKHRRGGRRSSAPSTSSIFSDIAHGISYDGNDSTASESKVGDMIRNTQLHFEGLLTSPPRQNTATGIDNIIDTEPLPFTPEGMHQGLFF